MFNSKNVVVEGAIQDAAFSILIGGFELTFSNPWYGCEKSRELIPKNRVNSLIFISKIWTTKLGN